MFISLSDFVIRAENFDLTKTNNVLRIICGGFMFPHALSKFVGFSISPPLLGFFEKAGFHPPEIWIVIAAAAEFACGVALVLGLCTRFAALGAAAVLGIAIYALQVVKGFGWTWNTGGYEFPVFWAIVCIAVAIDAWKSHLAGTATTVVARRPTARAA